MFTLVYDSDCGPCMSFSNVVGFIDAKHAIGRVGLAEADASGLLDALPPQVRHTSFHLVSPDGEVWSGANAFPTLLGLLPGGWPASEVLSRNAAAFRLSAFVYSVLARLHDKGSCRYAPKGNLSSPAVG